MGLLDADDVGRASAALRFGDFLVRRAIDRNSAISPTNWACRFSSCPRCRQAADMRLSSTTSRRDSSAPNPPPDSRRSNAPPADRTFAVIHPFREQSRPNARRWLFSSRWHGSFRGTCPFTGFADRRRTWRVPCGLMTCTNSRAGCGRARIFVGNDSRDFPSRGGGWNAGSSLFPDHRPESLGSARAIREHHNRLRSFRPRITSFL